MSTAGSGRSGRVVDRSEAAAARAETLTRMHGHLAEQVGRLATGEGWRAWLAFANSFHHYSFSNTMLIWSQNPEATMVAGYRKWQSLGRQVRRGEVGIRVFGPVTRRDVTTDVAGEPIRALDGKPEQTTSIVGVRPLAVFDVTQTDGTPCRSRRRHRC